MIVAITVSIILASILGAAFCLIRMEKKIATAPKTTDTLKPATKSTLHFYFDRMEHAILNKMSVMLQEAKDCLSLIVWIIALIIVFKLICAFFIFLGGILGMSAIGVFLIFWAFSLVR